MKRYQFRILIMMLYVLIMAVRVPHMAEGVGSTLVEIAIWVMAFWGVIESLYRSR